MFKLVLLSLQIAAILCAPAQEDAVAGDKKILLNNAVTEKSSEKPETAQVEGIPEGTKADIGADDGELPQKDGYLAYSSYNRQLQQAMKESRWTNALRSLQQEVNNMRYGTKGNSGLFREVGRYTGGSKGQVQREVQPLRMGSKGQTNLLREVGRYSVGSKGQSVQREIREPQPSVSCSLIQYELETTKLLNTNLKEQLENATNYVDKLTSQNNDLDKALTSAHLYNSKLKSENVALAAENGRLRAENEALEAENNNLKNLNANLRTENANLIKNNNELRSQNSALQQENDAIKAENSNLQAQNEALRNENTNLRNSNEQLRVENAALREQVRNLQNQVKNLEDTVSSLQAQVADLNNRLSRCNADKAVLVAEKARLQTTITALEAEISNLNNNLVNLRAENANLQVANNKLMEQNIKLNEDLVLLSASIANLQSEMMARCPVGYDRFGSKCYKYVKEKRTWKSAQEYCMSERGNLASINSKEEQEFITDLLKRVGAKQHDAYAYVGGSDGVIEGNWEWLGSKEPIVYPTFWGPGFPRGFGAADDCMSMYLAGKSNNFGQWTDTNCRHYLPSICELEP